MWRFSVNYQSEKQVPGVSFPKKTSIDPHKDMSSSHMHAMRAYFFNLFMLVLMLIQALMSDRQDTNQNRKPTFF